MIYQDLVPLSRTEYETLMQHQSIHRPPEAELLLRLSLSPDDTEWKQSLLISMLTDPNVAIQRAAIQALGHLARVGENYDPQRSLDALSRFLDHPDLAGVSNDAEDDIRMFISSK